MYRQAIPLKVGREGGVNLNRGRSSQFFLDRRVEPLAGALRDAWTAVEIEPFGNAHGRYPT